MTSRYVTRGTFTLVQSATALATAAALLTTATTPPTTDLTHTPIAPAITRQVQHSLNIIESSKR